MTHTSPACEVFNPSSPSCKWEIHAVLDTSCIVWLTPLFREAQRASSQRKALNLYSMTDSSVSLFYESSTKCVVYVCLGVSNAAAIQCIERKQRALEKKDKELPQHSIRRKCRRKFLRLVWCWNVHISKDAAISVVVSPSSGVAKLGKDDDSLVGWIRTGCLRGVLLLWVGWRKFWPC